MPEKNKKRSLTSVVLPTYNNERHIKKSIESVLSQTYRNIELIIVDENYIDGTRDIVAKISKQDPRIKILINRKKLGFVKSLNKGIGIAKGKYIARLDSDDFWPEKNKIRKQVEFLENNPSYVLTGGGAIMIDESGEEIFRNRYPEKNKQIRKAMLLNNPFLHSAILFKKDSFNSVGGYDEALNHCEDWDLWLRLGKVGKLYNFPNYFAVYFKRRQSRTNPKENSKASIKLKIRYRKDYPGFKKAILLGILHHTYNHLPFCKFFEPMASKLRMIIFGATIEKIQRNKSSNKS